MMRSGLCDYSDAHILFKGTIIVANTTADTPINRSKKVIFKNCAPFIDSIGKINNTEIDHGKDTEVVTPMYNLIQFSNNYLKIFGSMAILQR